MSRSPLDHNLWGAYQEDLQICLSGEVSKGRVCCQQVYPVQFNFNYPLFGRPTVFARGSPTNTVVNHQVRIFINAVAQHKQKELPQNDKLNMLHMFMTFNIQECLKITRLGEIGRILPYELWWSSIGGGFDNNRATPISLNMLS